MVNASTLAFCCPDLVEAKMSAPIPVPVVAVRGSTGISLNLGPPNYDPVTAFTRDDSKLCKTMFFSSDGKYLAWVNGTCVKVVLTSTWKVQCEIARPKVSNASFSPLGTYLITWEPFVVNADKPQGAPNLHFYKADTGDLVRAFVHKSQAGWDPQWSSDESLCARLLNNDVLFYENHSFDVSVNKCSPGKVTGFSLSPGPSANHVVVHLPGQSGQPSIVRLFQYPNFETTQASKSFFQSDRVEMQWNSKATAVLVLATSEIDKTGASYYGKQSLQFLATKGDACMVPVGAGSVYSAQWNPNGNEFCVVYGTIPPKTSLFNLKCEPIHHFPPANRNTIHYNPFGNLLLLGGFGNMRGGIEIYDSNHRRIVSRFEAPETTQLSWSPDGEHFFTATCAPRLRQGNGFKIWHYSGKQLYERPWNKQEELWEVLWQTFPKDTFKEPTIKIKPGEVIQNATAAKAPYRPPSARTKVEEAPAPTPETLSKSALKQKKRRENKKAKKDEDGQDGEDLTHHVPNSNNFGNGLPEGELPDDPEKQKKIKKLKSKIIEILRLKEQVNAGKKLEINQLEKIKKEDELVKELKELFM